MPNLPLTLARPLVRKIFWIRPLFCLPPTHRNQSVNRRCLCIRYRGFKRPEENVALPKLGASVLQGEVKSALLDGDSKEGFLCFYLLDPFLFIRFTDMNMIRSRVLASSHREGPGSSPSRDL